MKTVLLIDDHPVVGVGFGLVLRDSTELKLVGVAGDPDEGVTHLHALRPDALVVDLVFDGRLRIDLLARCRAAAPDAAIVVFSSLYKALYLDQVVAAGADAYLMKSTDLATLSRCVLDLLSARALEPHKARSPLVSEWEVKPLSMLDGVHVTLREMDVARRLAHGQSIASIAEALGMSMKTAAVHRDNLRKKLNCRDTKDLVARLARFDGALDARR